MSTAETCRREEVASCQPDKTVIVKPESKSCGSEQECAAISEKQFMRDHSMYSAVSS